MAAPETSLDLSDYRALAEFRYALRCFLEFSEEAATAAGLTPQQHQALLAIKGFSDTAPITVGDLAERLRLRHHSAVGLVDRLARLDLVRRESADGDRRQVRLVLTDKAQTLLEALSAAHRDELRRRGPTLAALLQRIGS